MGCYSTKEIQDDFDFPPRDPYRRYYKGPCNILLLGTSSSGQSTFFKIIQSIHGDKILINTLRQNCVNGMIQLLAQSDALYTSYKLEECLIDTSHHNQLTKKYIKTIHEFADDNSNKYDKYDKMQQLAEAMDYMWENTAIQATYKHILSAKYGLYTSKNYDIITNDFDYFLNKIHDLMKQDFSLSRYDYSRMIIHNKATTGIVKFEYKSGFITNNACTMLNVGCSYDERSKNWYINFDTVHSLMYFCALDDYCKPSNDNRYRNALVENFEIFREICNRYHRKFQDISIFFTKYELFKQSLKTKPLSYCFGITQSILLYFVTIKCQKEMNLEIPTCIVSVLMHYCQDLMDEYNFGWSDCMNENDLQICCQQSFNFIQQKYQHLNESTEIRKRPTSIHCTTLNVKDMHDVLDKMGDMYRRNNIR